MKKGSDEESKGMIDRKTQKKELFLQRLRQQDLPPPNDAVQESILMELIDLKGNTLKGAFCQKQIGYLQGLILALSQTSDSSNNSTTKHDSSVGETATSSSATRLNNKFDVISLDSSVEATASTMEKPVSITIHQATTE